MRGNNSLLEGYGQALLCACLLVQGTCMVQCCAAVQPDTGTSNLRGVAHFPSLAAVTYQRL